AYDNPSYVSDTERWNSTSGNVSGEVTSAITVRPIYYHQWSVTFGVISGNPNCADTPSVKLNYTDTSVRFQITVSTDTQRWVDCNTSSTAYAYDNPSYVSDTERWNSTSDNASGEVTSAITVRPIYWHQWQITVSTIGGFLNETYPSRVYWYDTGTQYNSSIYDDAPVTKWQDCGAKFNVSTPIQGPTSPRNVKYVCDDNESYASSANISYSFCFHAEFPADVKIAGENQGDMFGWSVSGDADYNNDNCEDIFVGAPYWNSSAGEVIKGKAYLFYGNISGVAPWSIGTAFTASSANSTWVGEAADDDYGFAVHAAYIDLNNDGGSELIVGAPRNDTPGQNDNRGRVYIYGLAEVPVVTVNLTTNDTATPALGETTFTTHSAGWYNKSVKLVGRNLVVHTDKNITLTVSVGTVAGPVYIRLFFDSQAYPSRYEHSAGVIPVATTRWVKSYWENDTATNLWLASYSKSNASLDSVLIKANITACADFDASTISTAKLTLKTAGDNLVSNYENVTMNLEASGTTWKLYNYSFSISNFELGIYKVIVTAVDTGDGDDFRFGDCNQRIAWFRVEA
ncbi:MAG: integrin alpha, partial [Candidatus Thermoplasmatota archaeon]|nr:integrin alpha [Candidatus Thermoplasmatota archaeon]